METYFWAVELDGRQLSGIVQDISVYAAYRKAQFDAANQLTKHDIKFKDEIALRQFNKV